MSFIFVIIILVLVFGFAILGGVLSFVFRILRFIFSFGRMKQASPHTQSEPKAPKAKAHKEKVLFNKQEAEDVEFEEVK